jgi:hypothetical protein
LFKNALPSNLSPTRASKGPHCAAQQITPLHPSQIMTKSSPGQVLRAGARGGQTYAALRHKLASQFMARSDIPLDLLNPFLRDKLFKLDVKQWRALDLVKRDWSNLHHLTRLETQPIQKHYESLLLDYIASNADRVNNLYVAAATISSAVLSDDGQAISVAMEALDNLDSQSLFSFRVFAAQRVYSQELLVQHAKQHMIANWLRRRFLYPFVYYSIGNTSDLFIDWFLSYVIPTELESPIERDIIKFLLCDEISDLKFPIVKFYIALLCHPFDACEIFLNHCELEFVTAGQISRHTCDALQSLVSAIKSDRAVAILNLVNRVAIPFVRIPNGDALGERFKLNSNQARFLANFADTSLDDQTFTDIRLSRPLAQLARMRQSRYPTTEDYNLCTRDASQWRFTDAGRLLNALLTSIFMVQRREYEYEARMLIRLMHFYGQLCPFILSSPSGPNLLLRRLLPLEIHVTAQFIEESTDESFHRPNDYRSRLWIKATHWSLRNAERKIRISAWLDIVRRDIRVAPSFLTGISWAWVDEIIRQVRLRPFRGSANGVYALLLAQIEDRTRDVTFLRAAIEPFVSSHETFTSFLRWLLSEYRDESVAFVRFFLSANNMLMLRLAPNYTAALSLRINALATCVKEFGFGALLDEDRFNQETNALTTSLLLMNVSAGQFEIPWEIFRNDISEKEADLYDVYVSFSRITNALPALGKSKNTYLYPFRNGKVVSYEFSNDDWPLVFLIWR